MKNMDENGDTSKFILSHGLYSQEALIIPFMNTPLFLQGVRKVSEGALYSNKILLRFRTSDVRILKFSFKDIHFPLKYVHFKLGPLRHSIFYRKLYSLIPTL